MYWMLCEKGLNFLEKTQLGFVMYLCYVHEDHPLMQLGPKTASLGFISKSVDTLTKKLNCFLSCTSGQTNKKLCKLLTEIGSPCHCLLESGAFCV
jgi:hypothetical protein